MQLGLENKLGGFLGFRTTEARSTIIFDRFVYSLGQRANIKIICDNSNCAKAVKEFKIKLLRQFTGTDYHETIKSQSYVNVLRDPGCPAHTKVERDYYFTIPD